MSELKSFIVSFDFSKEGTPLAVVGVKNLNESAKIVNVLIGDDARDIYDQLITVRTKQP